MPCHAIPRSNEANAAAVACLISPPQLLGQSDVELFSKGQVFYKEGGLGGAGANPKYMHQVGHRARHIPFLIPHARPRSLLSPCDRLRQDAAYFTFKKQGVCATLNYTTETTVRGGSLWLYIVA